MIHFEYNDIIPTIPIFAPKGIFFVSPFTQCFINAATDRSIKITDETQKDKSCEIMIEVTGMKTGESILAMRNADDSVILTVENCSSCEVANQGKT